MAMTMFTIQNKSKKSKCSILMWIRKQLNKLLKVIFIQTYLVFVHFVLNTIIDDEF